MCENWDGGDDGGKKVHRVFGKKIQSQVHRGGRRCGLLRLEVLNCSEARRAKVGGERASPERRESPTERVRRRWDNELHEYDVGKSEPMGTGHNQCGYFCRLQFSFRRHVVPSFSGSPPPFTVLVSWFRQFLIFILYYFDV